MTYCTPEQQAEQRVRLQTEREFAIERNFIADDPSVSHAEVREALEHCTHSERQVLKSRLRKRMKRLHELMATPRKSFDEPRVSSDDLTDSVTLSNEMLE